MPRIRSIHPGLFTDEEFMTASMAARVLLIGIWTECDDNGVFEWKPLRLKMRILPADNVDIEPLLDELAELRIIKKFFVGDASYGCVRNFCKWQKPKSPQSIHPLMEEMAEFTCSASRDRSEGRADRGIALGKMLLERQEGKCHYCGREITFYRKKPNSLEIDHRLPISRGGLDDIANLVATCRPCNSLKANLTDEEFRGKFSPAELAERHSSQSAKTVSQSAKTVSQSAIPPEGFSAPQREEGGGRKEDVGKEENQSPLPERTTRPPRARGAPPPSRDYAFQGAIIRLTQADFDRWRTSFGAIPDLVAELQTIDDKLTDESFQGKWFGRVSAWLRARHETLLSEQRTRASSRFTIGIG